MSEEEKKFLEIVDLKKGFGSGETRQEVLRGMNFSVAKGEFCVLLGPSGSGKSTLLNIIGGIDSADSGYISINGDKLEDMSEKKLTQYRRKHLGYVFQMYNLIANLNVKENIEVGAYLSDNALDIDELLQTLGLYEHRYKLPNQLSGAFCSNLLSGTILQPFYCCLQHFLKCTIFCLIFVFHKFSFVSIYSICVDFSFNLHYSCNYIIYNHQSIKKCTVYQHIKKNC